jgi:hypothetical protein
LDSLRSDYVFLCTPVIGVNSQGAAEKMLKMLDILLDVGTTNIGFYSHGSLMTGINFDSVRKDFNNNSRLRCCFDDREKLREVLRRLKAEDAGLSITISGPIAEILQMAGDLSLKPHTINISCGVFGKKELLSGETEMEITTMCGHGMIASRLVKDTISRLYTGEIDLDGAVQRLGEPCTCGIYNPTRTREILQNLTQRTSD